MFKGRWSKMSTHRKRVFAAALAVAVAGTSFNVAGLAVSADTSGEGRVITEFEALPSEIAWQYLPVGSEESMVQLPEELGVRLYSEELPGSEEPVVNPGSEEEPPVNPGGEETGEEPPAEPGGEEPVVNPGEEPSVEPGGGEDPSVEPGGGQEEPAPEEPSGQEEGELSAGLTRILGFETVYASEGEEGSGEEGTEEGSGEEGNGQEGNGQEGNGEEGGQSPSEGGGQDPSEEGGQQPGGREETRILKELTWKLVRDESAYHKFQAVLEGDVFVYEPDLTPYGLKAEVPLPKIRVTITKKEESEDGTISGNEGEETPSENEGELSPEFNGMMVIGGVKVTALAPEGVLPKGATLRVKKMEDPADREKIEGLISETPLVCFDITFTDEEGNEIQPDTSYGEVTVTFSGAESVEDAIRQGREIMAYHFDEELTGAESVSVQVDPTDGSASLTGTEFSPYVLAAPEQPQDELTLSGNTPSDNRTIQQLIHDGAIVVQDADRYWDNSTVAPQLKIFTKLVSYNDVNYKVEKSKAGEAFAVQKSGNYSAVKDETYEFTNSAGTYWVQPAFYRITITRNPQDNPDNTVALYRTVGATDVKGHDFKLTGSTEFPYQGTPVEVTLAESNKLTINYGVLPSVTHLYFNEPGHFNTSYYSIDHYEYTTNAAWTSGVETGLPSEPGTYYVRPCYKFDYTKMRNEEPDLSDSGREASVMRKVFAYSKGCDGIIQGTAVTPQQITINKQPITTAVTNGSIQISKGGEWKSGGYKVFELIASTTNSPYLYSDDAIKYTVKKDGYALPDAFEKAAAQINNLNVAEPGKYTVEINANASTRYTGTYSTTFTITGKSLANATVTIDPEIMVFPELPLPEGYGAEPGVVVVYQENTLKENEDYTLHYSDNRTEGEHTAKVTVSGINSFKGSSKEATFSIRRGTKPTLKFNDSSKTDSDWFNSGVKISSDGYQIALKAGGPYQNSVTYEDYGEGGKKLPVKVYLKKTSEPSIVYTVSDNLNIDPVRPVAKLKLSGTVATEDVVKLQVSPLKPMYFTNDSAKLKVGYDGQDALSGIVDLDKYHYFVQKASSGSPTAYTEKDLDQKTSGWTSPADTFIPYDGEDDITYIYLRVKDKAGNYGYASTQGICYDTKVPNLSSVAAAYANGKLTVTAKATDELSGVGTCYALYKKTNEAAPNANTIMTDAAHVSSNDLSFAYPVPNTLKDEGKLIVYCVVKDKAGNISTVKNYEFINDPTSPGGNIDVGGYTWSKLSEDNEQVAAILNKTEKISITGDKDTKKIHYFISDHGKWSINQLSDLDEAKWYSYSSGAKPPLNANAKNYVYARFAEESGATGFIGTEGILVDTVAPTISTCSIAPGEDRTTAAVTVTGLDNLSGVDQYYLLVKKDKDSAPKASDIVASGTADGEGIFSISRLSPVTAYTFYIVVKDAAGNISEIATVKMGPEEVTPTGSIQIMKKTWTKLQGSAKTVAYTNAKQSVAISGKEEKYGVESIDYYISSTCYTTATGLAKLDSKVWKTYNPSSKPELEQNKLNYVYARITGLTGAVAYISSEGIWYDTLVPSANSIKMSDIKDKTATVAIKGADAQSGIDKYYVWIRKDTDALPTSSEVEDHGIDSETGVIELKELTASTKYVAYGIVRDKAQNLSKVIKAAFTTAKAEEKKTPSSNNNKNNGGAGAGGAGKGGAAGGAGGAGAGAAGKNGAGGAGAGGAGTGSDDASGADAAIKTKIPFIGDASAGIAVGQEMTSGWDRIFTETEKAAEPSEIHIEMNGATVVPSAVLNEIANRNITYYFNMNDDMIWAVNGMSFTDKVGQDIDFRIRKDTKNIPSKLVNDAAGVYPSTRLSLAHDGDFGFSAILSLPFGDSNAGMYANLYYYNEDASRLDFMDSAQVRDNGRSEFEFAHASDYLVVLRGDALTVQTAAALNAGAVDTDYVLRPEKSSSVSFFARHGMKLWIFFITLISILLCAAVIFMPEKRRGQA